MSWYRVTLEMHSWAASAWQADTLFGHLCWGMRYLYGEGDLHAFLDAYREGKPPLLISNGFPDDLLPRPILPPSPVKTEEEFGRNKERRKKRLLPRDQFVQAIMGEDLSDGPNQDGSMNRFEARRVILKNQISRLTGTTGEEGRLYPFEEFRWKTVSLYLKVEENFVEKTRALFDYVAQSGYGKRKSVGYGQIRKLSFKPFEGFPTSPQANGFISLSNFVPAPHDPTRGHWSLLVKYGKLGEEYALGENPFKRPLLMLEAGSSFYDKPCREFYGRLVENVSTKPGVVQYAFALPVPMKLPVLR